MADEYITEYGEEVAVYDICLEILLRSWTTSLEISYTQLFISQCLAQGGMSGSGAEPKARATSTKSSADGRSRQQVAVILRDRPVIGQPSPARLNKCQECTPDKTTIRDEGHTTEHQTGAQMPPATTRHDKGFMAS